MRENPLLNVRGLEVSLAGGPDLISGVDLDVRPGEAVGLVGESGSGKSMLALAVAGLLPEGIRVTAGDICLGEENLLALPPRERRARLGRRIGMVFQEPRTSLHPAYPVGSQVAEAVRRTGATRREARARAVSLLGSVGIPDPERRSREYPHQFSGGMCQRVGLAIALAQDPALLLADEPTTALDVTIQAEVLELLGDLRAERGLALLLITHDLAVVAGHVSRVTVLYAGRVAEVAAVTELFGRPRHPYTRGLLRALPGGSGERLVPIRGTVPAPSERPPGCRFAPRCDLADAACDAELPDLAPRDGPGLSACLRAAEVPPREARDG